MGAPLSRPEIMTRAKEYRQRAKEAEDEANKTRDPFTNWGFLAIACQYRELAEQADLQASLAP